MIPILFGINGFVGGYLNVLSIFHFVIREECPLEDQEENRRKSEWLLMQEHYETEEGSSHATNDKRRVMGHFMVDNVYRGKKTFTTVQNMIDLG